MVIRIFSPLYNANDMNIFEAGPRMNIFESQKVPYINRFLCEIAKTIIAFF